MISPTLALEHLMTHPRFPEFLEHLRAATPTPVSWPRTWSPMITKLCAEPRDTYAETA